MLEEGDCQYFKGGKTCFESGDELSSEEAIINDVWSAFEAILAPSLLLVTQQNLGDPLPPNNYVSLVRSRKLRDTVKYSGGYSLKLF